MGIELDLFNLAKVGLARFWHLASSNALVKNRS